MCGSLSCERERGRVFQSPVPIQRSPTLRARSQHHKILASGTRERATLPSRFRASRGAARRLFPRAAPAAQSHAVRAARRLTVRRSGEEVAAPFAPPLDHAGQRLPRLRVDGARRRLRLQARRWLAASAGVRHKLPRPPLVQCALLPYVGRPAPAGAGDVYLWGVFLRTLCTPVNLTSRAP